MSSAIDEASVLTLTVQLIAGRDLVIRDLRSSDPYCVIRCLDAGGGVVGQARSATARSTLSPEWLETFTFAALPPDARLRVEVFDRDLMSPDDPMGELELGLTWLREAGEEIEAWFELQGVERGALRLKLSLSESKRVPYR